MALATGQQAAGYVTIAWLCWQHTFSVPKVNEALWWTEEQQYFLLPSWVSNVTNWILALICFPPTKISLPISPAVSPSLWFSTNTHTHMLFSAVRFCCALYSVIWSNATPTYLYKSLFMWDDTKGTFLSVLFLLLMSLFLLQPAYCSLLHGDVTGLQSRMSLFGRGGYLNPAVLL